MPSTDKPSSNESLLSASGIRSQLGDSLAASVLHLHASLESTNTYLLQSVDGAAVEICATELQTRGRGRRGKVWSTPKNSVTFSMKLTVPVPLSQIGGASLVCGVALCDTFHRLGVSQAAVKWPNDILVGGAKLAGILVEIATHNASSTTLVVGIGINYRAGPETEKIDREIIDLHQLFAGDPPDRSQLIGTICNRIHADLASALPLAATFVENWRSYDALAGQSVVVQRSVSCGNTDSVAGNVEGIDKRGYLVVETNNGTRFFSSAEVSIQKSTNEK